MFDFRAHNKIKKLEGLENLPNLKNLDMSKNKLVFLDDNSFIQSTHLKTMLVFHSTFQLILQ